VTIFAAALAPKGLSDELKILTSATGGRFWEAKSASDLALAVLNFYEQLAHPQERRLLWLALVGVGVAVLLVAELFFWQDKPDTGDAAGEVDADGAPGKNILRLQAQLEALSKEKAQLHAALEEKNQQAATLLAEKADLQADLERIRAKTKGNVQSIEELEKKLEEAEREAQGVQQEYTALYARNQQERENIKKN
jgi:hypothetical protein